MDAAQLVKQCQTGDREAFGRLYILYAPSMQRVVEAYVHDHEAAQDILHDGFIVAYSSLASLNKPASFEPWLTRIMKNLSLQYLRDVAGRKATAAPDTLGDGAAEEEAAGAEPSLDELLRMVDRLPAGYGKVFRLAVLDGLSHKEIGERLGIAPHSSSSQLSHAKAMLRRLITEYRVGIGAFGLLALVFTARQVWLRTDRQAGGGTAGLVAEAPGQEEAGGEQEKPTRTGGTASPGRNALPAPAPAGHRAEIPPTGHPAQAESPVDTTTATTPEDSVARDTGTPTPDTPFVGGWLADDAVPARGKRRPEWSLAVAYAGAAGQNGENSYRVPVDPGLDCPTGVPEEAEVHEQSRHHVPFVVGLSLSKSLTERWRLETGIRYSYLRSDFLRESRQERTETIQRVHYVGIPLKCNYLIFGTTRFSLYGQAGIGLDIPVHATLSTTTVGTEGSGPVLGRRNVQAPLQWSVEGGLGMQFRISSTIGIYAEPSFRYYFNPGSGIRTIRQDKPSDFSIPLGIRFNW